MQDIINRLVSITSINQLIAGISCLHCNLNENLEYHDILIVNNVMVKDIAFQAIKTLAEKVGNFKKVIDFRQELIDLNNKFKSTGKITKTFFIPKCIEEINEILKRKTDYVSFDEVYLRYKINLPEHLVLSVFPNASLFLFEDGAGDYVKPYPERYPKRIKQILRKTVAYLIKDSFLRNSWLNKDYNKRVVKIFSIIYDGDSSDNIGRMSGKHYDDDKYINIKKNYINILSRISPDLDNRDYILLVLHPYSEFEISVNGVGREMEIDFYRKVLEVLKEKHPDKRVIMKAHPNTSITLRKEYIKSFGTLFMPEYSKYSCRGISGASEH